MKSIRVKNIVYIYMHIEYALKWSVMIFSHQVDARKKPWSIDEEPHPKMFHIFFKNVAVFRVAMYNQIFWYNVAKGLGSQPWWP